MKIKFSLSTVKEHIHLSGILGALLLTFAMLLTIPFFRGYSGEPFNPLTHFISELGISSIYPNAHLFNASLMMAGMFLAVFIIRFSLALNSHLSLIAGFFGVLSSIACSYMGIFPIDNIAMHFIGAYVFFYSGMLSVLLYGLAVYFNKNKLISKRYSLTFLISFISYLLFLFFIEEIPKEPSVTEFVVYRKSPVWLPALFEWFVFFSIGLWIISISHWFLKKKKTV